MLPHILGLKRSELLLHCYCMCACTRAHYRPLHWCKACTTPITSTATLHVYWYPCYHTSRDLMVFLRSGDITRSRYYLMSSLLAQVLLSAHTYTTSTWPVTLHVHAYTTSGGLVHAWCPTPSTAGVLLLPLPARSPKQVRDVVSTDYVIYQESMESCICRYHYMWCVSAASSLVGHQQHNTSLVSCLASCMHYPLRPHKEDQGVLVQYTTSVDWYREPLPAS